MYTTDYLKLYIISVVTFEHRQGLDQTLFRHCHERAMSNEHPFEIDKIAFARFFSRLSTLASPGATEESR